MEALKFGTLDRKVVRSAVMEPQEGEERRDCWAVTFGNSYNSEERVVAAGYDNGGYKDVRFENHVCSMGE